jgi:hypothetical protein
MIRIGLKQTKIPWPIVVFLAVYMIHNFMWLEHTAQQALHYQPMFTDIPTRLPASPLAPSFWVVRHVDQHIA